MKDTEASDTFLLQRKTAKTDQSITEDTILVPIYYQIALAINQGSHGK